jgi:uncharacterized RDD family membrane protein YckC
MDNETTNENVLASPGHRIGAVAVDLGLYIVTFGIGYFIWNAIVMAQGQSPGKQLLKVRVMSEANKKSATWGHMFIRNVLITSAMPLPFFIPYYVWLFKGFSYNFTGVVLMTICFLIYLAILIVDIIWLFGPKRKRLIDYWAKTYVINEANINKSIT